MPKVSIVVPVYNVAQYLNECIDSIVNQTLEDIEIICVNDGSTDNSLEILKEYAQKDPRVKIIDKKNSGYGDSMNKGFDAATGEYIGIVESDDYIVPNMFETLYNKAKENDVDFIKADFCRFYGEPDNRTFTHVRLDRDSNYYNRVINPQEDLTPFRFVMNTWSGIYKREFLNKYGIRHNTTPGASYQDNGFWFQTFALAKRIYFLDTPFYMLRRDNPNSSINSKGKVFLMKYEYDFIRNFIEKYPDLKPNLLGVYQYKRFHNYLFNYNRIDIKYKKDFLKVFVQDYREAAKANEIDYTWFYPKELKTLKLILKNPNKFYRKSLNKLSLGEKIFSITNVGLHKNICILGVKIKIKNKRKELLNKIDVLLEKVNSQKKVNNQLLAGLKYQEDVNKNNITKLDNLDKYVRASIKELKLQNEELKLQNEELMYRNVFIETIKNSQWLKDTSFTLIKGAANYSFVFQLYMILDMVKPHNILELGLGQTSLITTQYSDFYKANLNIVDHDSDWIDYFSKKLVNNNNFRIFQKNLIKFDINGVESDKYESLADITTDTKYDLIIVDGPFGYDRKYPRTNILDLIPANLSENFVIVLDDAEREGEKNTAKLIFQKLKEAGIKYKRSYKSGMKTQLIISSLDYNFIHWY